MAQKYLMAVDAGTGSVRAVLFDLAGNQLACVQREWEHKEDPRWPGSMDFDWVHNWGSLLVACAVFWPKAVSTPRRLPQFLPPACAKASCFMMQKVTKFGPVPT